jgi:hypothetical protein
MIAAMVMAGAIKYFLRKERDPTLLLACVAAH